MKRVLEPRRGAPGSFRRRMVASATGTLVLNVGALLWNFAGIVALTRLLGVDSYGAYTYAAAWATVLCAIALLGFPQLLVRHVASHHAADELGLVGGIIRWSYRRFLVAATATVAAGAAIGGWLLDGDVRTAFLIGLLLIPLIGLFRVDEAVMRGLQHVIKGRLAETTVQPVGLLVMLVACAVIGADLSATSAMALTVTATAAAALVAHLLVRRAVPQDVRSAHIRVDARSWYGSMRALSVLTVAQTLHVQIGFILLGMIGDVGDTALLSAALRWATFVTFLQLVLTYPLAPAVVRLHVDHDHARLQGLVRRAAMSSSAAALAIAVVLVLFRDPLLAVFGESFAAGGTALAVLAVGELIGVVCGAVAMTLTMLRHERVVARAYVAAVLLNGTLGLVLIPSFGVTGAAFARTAAVVALNVSMVVVLWRREGVYSAAVGRRFVGRRAGAS